MWRHEHGHKVLCVWCPSCAVRPHLAQGIPALSCAPRPKPWSNTLASSGHRRRRGRRPESAIGLVNMRPDVSEGNAVIQHAHHVPRDVRADLSMQAHEIEHDAAVRLDVLNVTISDARVALLRPTPAEARDPAEGLAIGHSKAVGFLHTP